VESASSAVERAVRNLKRTKIRAPYDGRVSKRNVGLGQQIGGSTALGEIFSTDFAEVRLPLTTRDLEYYKPPQKPGERGIENNITFTSILMDSEEKWQGTILRAEGELDEDSRQLFVIARIDDPFALNSKSNPLYIGQPVRATIPAIELKDVYLIPREHMSGLNEVLLVRDGKFVRVGITPIWSGKTTIITRDGIIAGDQITTSRLPYAPDGAPVEIIVDPVNEEKNSSKPDDSRSIGKKRSHAMK
jgi:multidrug efflux pump subunit AcrA (membrane-fusion protein)